MKQEAAYHEAGHAVIAGALGCKVRLVIIDPNGGGECQCDDPPEGECERKIMLCFAGPAAQRKHEPGSWKGWHGNDDYRKAVELVQGLGVSDERLSALIRETHGLVEQHWARIERFAHVLLERGTLQGDEIDALIAEEHIRPKRELQLNLVSTARVSRPRFSGTLLVSSWSCFLAWLPNTSRVPYSFREGAKASPFRLEHDASKSLRRFCRSLFD